MRTYKHIIIIIITKRISRAPVYRTRWEHRVLYNNTCRWDAINTSTLAHTLTHTHTPARTHSRTHARTHTHAHTHTDTLTHTH